MKRNINWKIPPLPSTFKLTMVLFLLINIPFQIHAQRVSKTYEKEIQVSSNATIIATSPRVLNIEGHGQVTIDNTRDKINIYGKGETPGFSMPKDFEIKTWDKQTVKQVFEISVEGEDQAEIGRLFDRLELVLEENSIGEVRADCNLNLNRIIIKNGFFTKDKFTAKLDDGTSFDIMRMEIKAYLTIPKKSNLKINSKHNHVIIGDLDGTLTLNMYYGSPKTGKVRNLIAKLDNCFEVKFGKLENAQINAKGSWIDVEEVGTLDIGNESTLTNWDVEQNEYLRQFGTSVFESEFTGTHPTNLNSMMTTYNIGKVENLIIAETANDKFNIGEVKKMQSGHSVFSNYRIKKLTGSLLLTAKSGDLTIDEVAKNFKQIDLNNELSTVILNMNNDSNYRLNTFNNRYSEYVFPSDLKLVNEKDSWTKSYLKGKKEGSGEINLRCDRCKISVYN